jgi:hypothetical protein
MGTAVRLEITAAEANLARKRDFHIFFHSECE